MGIETNNKLEYSLFDLFKGKEMPPYVFPAELNLNVHHMLEDTLFPNDIE